MEAIDAKQSCMAKNRPAGIGGRTGRCQAADGIYDEAKLAEWGILILPSQLPQGWQKALKHGAFQVI